MTYEEAKIQIQAIPEKIWDQLSEPDREAMEMAFSALQAQEAKTQLSAEGTTSDLISRKDAIEVIEEMQMPIMRSMFPEEQFVFKGMSEALSAIKDLPSAQPEIEERTEEFAQNVPKEDLISRKAAIDAMGKAQWAKERLMELPSAQPEPLVKESRTLVKDLVKDTISRQAAISELMEWVEKEKNKSWSPFKGLFHWTGIKAMLECLPSAQPEPCEDAVSRDSVKFLLCKETCHPGAFCPDGFCREICEKVDALPSATPKQRMGEWIPVSERLPEYTKTKYVLFKGDEYHVFNTEKEACAFLGVKQCSVAGAWRDKGKCKGWNVIRIGNGADMRGDDHDL